MVTCTRSVRRSSTFLFVRRAPEAVLLRGAEAEPEPEESPRLPPNCGGGGGGPRGRPELLSMLMFLLSAEVLLLEKDMMVVIQSTFLLFRSYHEL